MAVEEIDFSLTIGFQRGILPDPIIKPSEWANNCRVLPDTAGRPGKFSTDLTPYVVEILDRLSVHDPAQEVYLQKSSQVGGTEIGNNWLGYIMDAAPGPTLYVMPTDTMMKDTSKNRIEKMIENTPALSEKISLRKAKDKSNTLLYKEFQGGFIKMVGANSPVGLSSIAVRNVYMDEIDRYPLSVGGEGSAEGLAKTRTITYGARKKMLLTSTPTIKGISAIAARFETTGQRYYHVPCPFCGQRQPLVLEQLKYEQGNYQDVKYQCIYCENLIDERFKSRMMKPGLWMPKYPEREDGITYGYFINALYSPSNWYPWSQLAKEKDECENDIPKKIVFTNTKLGLAYEHEEKGDKPDWENIYDRAEDYQEGVPFTSVAFITAGVDVQADRLEVEVVGWIMGKTTQSIEYIQIIGDTSQDEVWTELGKILNKTWVRERDNAVIPLRLMALDTGYNTVKCYEFSQKHGINRVIPVKGMDKLSVYFSAPKSVDILKVGKPVGKVKVWGIGVSLIKTDIYGKIKVRIDHETGLVPDGYCHFPKREPSYFRGLTAEEVVQVNDKKGFSRYEWVKKYKRNEPLDCRVYARAAAAVVGMDRWSPERWKREAGNYEQKSESKQKNKPTPKKKSDFWG